jgi:hypothetical protein
MERKRPRGGVVTQRTANQVMCLISLVFAAQRLSNSPQKTAENSQFCTTLFGPLAWLIFPFRRTFWSYLKWQVGR